jgi:hypothetical protein
MATYTLISSILGDKRLCGAQLGCSRVISSTAVSITYYSPHSL